MKKRCDHSRGFSLVEVALSLAILAVAMTGVLALLPVGLDSARQVHAETIAATLVRSAIGEFSTNGLSQTAFNNISSPPLGAIAATQYYGVEGQLLSAPTNAVFVLELQKGESDATSCRYFFNLAWPYAAWKANSNSVAVQRRTFVSDVVRNF